jgi:hypothetical protein
MTCCSVLIAYIQRQNKRSCAQLWLRIGKVTAFITGRADRRGDFGISGVSSLVKRILNEFSQRADAAVDRSRLAALPLRYLDDVGMTLGERAAILGFEEPTHDPWAPVVFHGL